jgi:hypothetical protein
MHRQSRLGVSSHHDPLFGPQASLWQDLGLRSLLPEENTKEVPPGMAGAKRGPERDRSVGARTISDEVEEGDEEDEEGGEGGEGQGEEEDGRTENGGRSFMSRGEGDDTGADGGDGEDSLIEEELEGEEEGGNENEEREAYIDRSGFDGDGGPNEDESYYERQWRMFQEMGGRM